MSRPYRPCTVIALAAVGTLGLRIASTRADLTFVAGTDQGPPGQLRSFDATGNPLLTLTPYGPAFTGGVRVAVGDLTGDGHPDIVTGAGPGAAGGHVRVFDGTTGAMTRDFLSYPAAFTGGVRIATGDVTGDGIPDIVTGADAGAGGGHVKVFDGNSGAQVRSFFAYDAGFTGGVRVAAGDVNGDGRADIITGAGAGGAGGHVKVFDGQTGTEVRSFFAYDAAPIDGVDVGAGDVNGDGLADIITGAGSGGVGGHVKVFSGDTGSQLASFFAFDGFAGGVRVATGDVNGDGLPDLAAALDASLLAEVRFFSPGGVPTSNLLPFGPSYTGGLFIAAAAVPEPATATLLTLATLITTRRPRRPQSIRQNPERQ